MCTFTNLNFHQSPSPAASVVVRNSHVHGCFANNKPQSNILSRSLFCKRWGSLESACIIKSSTTNGNTKDGDILLPMFQLDALVFRYNTKVIVIFTYYQGRMRHQNREWPGYSRWSIDMLLCPWLGTWLVTIHSAERLNLCISWEYPHQLLVLSIKLFISRSILQSVSWLCVWV